MKKVRVSLNRGIKSWSFFVHDSSESAFYLRDLGEDEDFDEEYRRMVTIERKDIVEMEWLGSEWVHHEEVGHSERYDMVRLAKIVTPGNVSSASYIEIYSGWVIGDTFDWSGKTDRPIGVKITPIKGRMKHKLDFSQIFSATKDDNEDKGVPMILN